jgi:hypothetical protein
MTYLLPLSQGCPTAFGGWFFLEKKMRRSMVSTYGSMRKRSE